MALPGNFTNNRSQFSGFRVFLYRLDIPGSIQLGDNGPTFTINELLQMDSSSAGYAAASKAMRKNVVLQKFLKTVRDGVKSGISSGLSTGLLYRGGSVFRQIDITPLVSSVSTHLNLESENACTINFIDSSVQDFGSDNLKKADKVMPRPSADTGRDSTLSPASPDYLRGIVLKEFDFIRVEAYSRVGETPEDRLNGFKDIGLEQWWSMEPMFTGLVVNISRSSSVGSSSTFVASCMGISRIFTQSVTVFNKALAQVFTEEGDESLRILDSDMNLLGNSFQSKNSVDVFKALMTDYLHPRFVGSAAKIGVADLRSETWDGIMTYDATTKDNKNVKRETLVPYLPLLVCYHILKHMNMEPIVLFDDKVDGKRSYVSDPGDSPNIPVPVPRDSEGYNAFLKPYLDMIRTTYQLFDSSYVPPYQVINEIRSNSFFEIFEDRTGAFHFRFPRYNMASHLHVCNNDDTVSVSLEKSDSAVYNMTLAQNMMATQGAIQGIAGKHYIDRLSVFRYGMRLPQIVENPNALDSDFSVELSQFLRDSMMAKTSRTATVKRLLDLSINVGDMVMFEAGPPGKSVESSLSGGDEVLFVGYVTSISESIAVSGDSSQTLSLSYVRPVITKIAKGRGHRDPTTLGSSTADSFSMTAREAARLVSQDFVSSNRGFLGTRKVTTQSYGKGQDGLISKLKEIDGHSRVTSSYTSTNADDYLVRVSTGSIPGAMATFKYVADPIVLAKMSVDSSVSSKTKQAIISGKEDNGFTVEQKADVSRSLRKSLDEQASVLGGLVHVGKVYENIIKLLAAGTDYSAEGALPQNNLPPLPGLTPIRDQMAARHAIYGSIDAGNFTKAGNAFREYIKRAKDSEVKILQDSIDTAVFGASSTAEIIMRFPNDKDYPSGRPVVPTDMQIRAVSDSLIVSRAAQLYTGDGKRYGSDWFNKEYSVLFAEGAKPKVDQYSIESGRRIFEFIENNYMPFEAASLDQSVLENNTDMQLILDRKANIEEEMAAAKTASGGTKSVAASHETLNTGVGSNETTQKSSRKA